MNVGTFQGIREQTFLREIDSINLSIAKIVMTESINGYDCFVIDNGETNNHKTIWISADLGLPIKVENNNATRIYKNVQAGSGTIDDKDLVKP